jgi:hypothetical protein
MNNIKRYIITEENERFLEYMEDINATTILSEFLEDYEDYVSKGGKIGTQISDSYKEKWYPLISAEQLKNAYLEQMNKGKLYNYSKIVYQWFGIIMRNAARLIGNTELAGHSSSCYIDMDYFVYQYNSIVSKYGKKKAEKKIIDKYNQDSKQLNMYSDDEAYNDINNGSYEKENEPNKIQELEIGDVEEYPIKKEYEDESFTYGMEIEFEDGKTVDLIEYIYYIMGDWMEAPDGSDAYSDFGIDPLMEIIDEYDGSSTSPEECIVLINRALDITHCRGDMASMFIEGGTATLTKISNEAVLKNNRKMISEKYIFN